MKKMNVMIERGEERKRRRVGERGKSGFIKAGRTQAC